MIVRGQRPYELLHVMMVDAGHSRLLADAIVWTTTPPSNIRFTVYADH